MEYEFIDFAEFEHVQLSEAIAEMLADKATQAAGE